MEFFKLPIQMNTLLTRQCSHFCVFPHELEPQFHFLIGFGFLY
jgi:hypothetical protein